MKLLIQIDDELFTRMKSVSKSSLNNFVLIAIENQISIEESKTSDMVDLTTLDQNKSNLKSHVKTSLEIPKVPRASKEITIDLNYYRKDRLSFIRNENTIRNPLKPLKNYFIWGQYNKIFPIKFSLRCLAKMQSDSPNSPIILTNLHEQCSNAAIKIKEQLIVNDTKNNRVWGENFSAGLPFNDKDKKSQYRFISHFIGNCNSQGDTVGALGDYGFAIIENGQIYFTQPGIQFAELTNPILDIDIMSETLLASEEIDFLLKHMKDNLPREWNGIQKIIKWISEGNNTPELLNGKIKSLDLEGKWTEKMVNTMRTGLMGRMRDMNLIYREKIGNKSFYSVTETARKVGEI